VTLGPALGPVGKALEEGFAGGVAPALVALVLRGGVAVHRSAHGAAGPDDLFDVASLTKVLATGSLAARLHAAGALDLDAPASRWLTGFGGEKEAVTVRHLLAHASGLPAWRRLPGAPGDPARAAELAEDAVARQPLEAAPGSRAVYSDLGFVALGRLLEYAGGAPLDLLADERVAPGLRRAFFLPERSRPWRRPAAPRTPSSPRFGARAGRSAPPPSTTRTPKRSAASQGTQALAAAGDVAALGQAWLEAFTSATPDLPAAAARRFAARDPAPQSTRALAWDTPSPAGSSLGSRLGRGARGAIGHLGFTGCSLWVDLEAEVVCALLTSHCPRRGQQDAIRSFRARFHDAVAQALGIG
jgi:CubicO group peptidase (beta-lactamase class C family)